MADDGVTRPLLPGFDVPPRRRFRRCRSAPLAESLPAETNGIGLNVRSGSMFGNMHPSFRVVTIYLTAYLGMGTVCFYLVRHQIKGEKTNELIDAVYFVIVTMTTVGYGDLVPNSILTKLLACAFVFTGMALGALVLSRAADYLVEKQEILLVKALHQHDKAQPMESMKEIDTNKEKIKCLLVSSILLLLIVCGTLFLIYVEELDPVDAFYCVCATITTLGYGDQSFSTSEGRVFAIFWIFTSTICLAQVLLYTAELNTVTRQRAFVKWVLNRKVTSLDLEAADLNDDGAVEVAEFVIYKLKEMGKISQDDIYVLLREFENLDVDQSGTLSIADITLVQ